MRDWSIFRILFLACFIVFTQPDAARSEAVVTQITPLNASQLLVASPDRHGGIGDWYLSNDRIWAIIDDVSNQNQLSLSGGTLLDLGLAGHDADQLIQVLQLINMTRDLIIPYNTITTECGENWAAITVSTANGLMPERPGFGVLDEDIAKDIAVKTEYRVVSGENFLRIKSTIRNNGRKRARIFNVADIVYWGDDAIKPFASGEKTLGKARGTPRGFHHPELDPSSPLSIVRSIGGFTYIAGGGANGLSPISYALCSPTEYQKKRLLWGVNDRLVSGIGVFTGNFNRALDLWKILFFGIAPGEELVYERVLVVGGRNDAASATDTAFLLLGMTDANTGVMGRVSPKDAETSVVIYAKKDRIPVTQLRPVREGLEAGSFKAVLPSGDYVAQIRSLERDPNLATPRIEPLTVEFTVEQGKLTNLGEIELPQTATLLVEVFEGERHSPARVIIQGSSGTPDPELGSDLLDFTLDGKPTRSSNLANWILLDGNETAPVPIELRPGKYNLYATRGFEYSVARAEADLSRPGAQITVKLSLSKVIETPGMMSGDFHVHSVASADSALAQEQRVISFVAEGVDLLIATDHDNLTDYAPIISKLNLQDRVASIVGVEATSAFRIRATPFTIGHYNAWPLRYDFNSPRRGAARDEGIRPRDLFERLRAISDGDSLIQVNHGRSGEPDGEASYFNALGLDFATPLAYNPSKPLTESPNSLLLTPNSGGIRDIDFDAMELLNGHDYREYLLLRADWFSLLNQGYPKTATANSDTHLKADLPGYPRNYIFLDDPTAERADNRTLITQIARRRVMGTTGPIILIDANSAKPGDVLTDTDGAVTLTIKILAADWVPVSEARVFANGEQVEAFKVAPTTQTVRLEQTITMTLEKDTWLVAEAGVPLPERAKPPEPPGGLYNIIAPGFVPLAFTNPVFIDADGNGTFDPPGLTPTPTHR